MKLSNGCKKGTKGVDRPGQVHEVKGEVVGLCEWVEVHVVVAKEVVTAKGAEGRHLPEQWVQQEKRSVS